MRSRLEAFFRIPPDVKLEFWQDTLQKNQLSLLVICIMIFGMELFNMARVLFWSASGLGTANNRLYFTMYCLLWLSAALYILLWRRLRRSSVGVRWAVQYGTALFALLWHTCINAYDLMRSPQAETSIFITAVLGLAVFIQMPSLYSLAAYGLAYGLFMWLAGPILSNGTIINLTITTIVALAVSWTSCRHAVVMISQRREIDLMNRQLQELVRKDHLTGLLNAAACRREVESHLALAGSNRDVALIVLDLDDFKAVNDSFGHPCGDYVLKETALRLQSVFPHAIGTARIGGDEFMLALSGTAAEQIEAAARRLIQEVSQIRWRGQPVGVCCSLGVCRARCPGAAFQAMYEAADQALYQAKSGGKGRCVFRVLDTASGRTATPDSEV